MVMKQYLFCSQNAVSKYIIKRGDGHIEVTLLLAEEAKNMAKNMGHTRLYLYIRNMCL